MEPWQNVPVWVGIISGLAAVLGPFMFKLSGALGKLMINWAQTRKIIAETKRDQQRVDAQIIQSQSETRRADSDRRHQLAMVEKDQVANGLQRIIDHLYDELHSIRTDNAKAVSDLRLEHANELTAMRAEHAHFQAEITVLTEKHRLCELREEKQRGDIQLLVTEYRQLRNKLGEDPKSDPSLSIPDSVAIGGHMIEIHPPDHKDREGEKESK